MFTCIASVFAVQLITIIVHSGVSGFVPERLRKDMTWNRLANVQGKEGENIGMDLLNEFLNNEFKGDLYKKIIKPRWRLF